MMIEPLANTPFNARLLRGHEQRNGHTAHAVQVSQDGILWHTIWRCCGESVPATVDTWEDVTPAPDKSVVECSHGIWPDRTLEDDATEFTCYQCGETVQYW